MAVPELLNENEAAVAADVHRVGPSKTRSILTGLALLVVGVVVVVVGLKAMTHTTAFVRVPVVLVGLAGIYKGLDVLGKHRFGSRFDTGLWLCLGWLILVVGAAVFADILPLAEHQDTTKTIRDPLYARPDLISSHPLGTNRFSLDLLARVIYGARVSLLTALLAVVLSLIVGMTIGVLAGYYRGWGDQVIGVITDALLSFPPLLLLVAVGAVIGKPKTPTESVVKVGIALAIVSVPTMLRIARANTLVYAQREFVVAARAMGAKNLRIVVRELFPNVLLPLVSYAFIIVAALIVAEGSLGFLGLGLQQPKPTWGNMIAEGREIDVLRKHPHVVFVPATVMFLTVFSFNRVGEKARQLWDPRDVKV